MLIALLEMYVAETVHFHARRIIWSALWPQTSLTHAHRMWLQHAHAHAHCDAHLSATWRV